MVEQEITLEYLKKAFFRNVIQIGDEVTRFVAYVDWWGSGSNNGEAQNARMRIFVPTSWDNDYNLVLSLATNGKTYPVYDLDTVASIEFATGVSHLTVTPSSSNAHGYSQIPTDFASYMGMMTGDGPLANEGYWTMNHTKGYAGLRPPWESKIWGDEHMPARALQPMYYHNFDWDGIDIETPPPLGVSLEDLFGDE